MESKRVLVVDDDADLLRGLCVRLRAGGYDVLVAADAASAAAVADSEEPDLVLLDLGLPGADGFVVMERLLKLDPTLPIVILTAGDPAISRDRALQSGALAYFQKPADHGTLLRTIGEALGGTDLSRADDSGGEAAALEGIQAQVSSDETGLRHDRERSVSPARFRILLVDDDLDFLRMTSLRLKAVGYDVVTSTDAISTVGAVRSREPDLIVLDLSLPGGDGFFIMERLRCLRGRDIPIVVVTARDSRTDRDRALRSGAAAFMQKPVDYDGLFASIRVVLGDI